MRIALGQLNTTVGAFEQNLAKIEAAAGRAHGAGAQLLVLPEQTLPGYPARDLLELPAFVAKNLEALAALEQVGALPEALAVCVGFAGPHAGVGVGLHNAAAVIQGGRRLATARKQLLPTYDVFDEARYFDRGEAVTLVALDGVQVAVTICEDLWNDARFWPRRRYGRDPLEEAVEAGAQLVVNLSASPYAIGKRALRESMLCTAAKRYGIPIAYCNLVGGNDALVFDGGSVVIDHRGQVIARARAFDEELLVAEVEPAKAARSAPTPAPSVQPQDPLGEVQALTAGLLDELLDALTLGLRDYVRKTGFRSVVLGLSGGIDSALVAVLAARALGPEAVLGVALPSRYTAAMSNDDAAQLASTLGIRLERISIEQVHASFLDTLAPLFAGHPPDTTEENLQARSRAVLLMALSNKFGALLLTTGNKSELGAGYCTLYGDMAGGLAVLGDVPKTLVYALARHVNREGEVIPSRTIERPPSAELREDQTDQDTLPPYETLDRILHGYIVERRSVEQLVEQGEDEAMVRRTLSLVLRSEFKRRQAAPVLKVTRRAFGDGWRFPIAHAFRFDASEPG